MFKGTWRSLDQGVGFRERGASLFHMSVGRGFKILGFHGPHGSRGTRAHRETPFSAGKRLNHPLIKLVTMKRKKIGNCQLEIIL